MARAIAVALVAALAVTGRAQETKKTPQELAQALAEKDAEVRNGAAAELEALGLAAAPAIHELIKLLEHPEPSSRTLAYEALAKIGPVATPSVLNALHEARSHPSTAGQATWLRAVLWEYGPGALPAVHNMLGDEDVDKRAAAVDALGFVGAGDKRTPPTLLALLKDEPPVSRQAYQSMAALGRHAAKCARILGKGLTKGDAEGRYGSAMALRFILVDASLAEETPAEPDPVILASIGAAQEWLVKHQDVDGGGAWHAKKFADRCDHKPRCSGDGDARYDVGVTGLALLALMPGGGLDRVTAANDPLGPTVRRGLHWLISRQTPDGCISSKSPLLFMYNHGIATQALAEAYGRTRNPIYGDAAFRGVRFIEQVRRPEWGWRYEPGKKDCDSSVTAWMLSTLKIAELGGIPVDRSAVKGGLRWISAMTEDEFGRTGYQQKGGGSARTEEAIERFPADRTESLTAITLNARALAGARLADRLTTASAQLVMDMLPFWDAAGHLDMYYWASGSQALFRLGHPKFAQWSAALAKAALPHQNKTPEDGRFGSWDPDDPWGFEGGRIYSTSMMLISLECVTGRVSRFRRTALKSADLRNALKEMELVAREPAAGHEDVKAVAADTVEILAELGD